MRKNFSMNDVEYERGNEWWKQHLSKCKYQELVDSGQQIAIHTGMSVKFSPNSISCGVEVSCGCGAEESYNVTDYDSW